VSRPSTVSRNAECRSSGSGGASFLRGANAARHVLYDHDISTPAGRRDVVRAGG
jgi:hypothetical protein